MPRHLRKFQKYKNVCRLFVHYLHWFLRNIEHFLMIPCNTEWTLYEGVYILFMWDRKWLSSATRDTVTPEGHRYMTVSRPYMEAFSMYICIHCIYHTHNPHRTRLSSLLPNPNHAHFSSSTILNLFNRNPVYGLSWFTDSNIYINIVIVYTTLCSQSTLTNHFKSPSNLNIFL